MEFIGIFIHLKPRHWLWLELTSFDFDLQKSPKKMGYLKEQIKWIQSRVFDELQWQQQQRLTIDQCALCVLCHRRLALI